MAAIAYFAPMLSDENLESSTEMQTQATDDDFDDEDDSSGPIIIIETVSVELKPNCNEDEKDAQPEPHNMGSASTATPLQKLLTSPANVQ